MIELQLIVLGDTLGPFLTYTCSISMISVEFLVTCAFFRWPSDYIELQLLKYISRWVLAFFPDMGMSLYEDGQIYYCILLTIFYQLSNCLPNLHFVLLSLF